MAKDGKRKQDKPQLYDRAYKQIFTHSRVVADMLEHIMPRDEINKLDLTTLEELSTELVTGETKQSLGDAVWQVRHENDKSYMLVLIKLKPLIDSDMALQISSDVATLRRNWMSTRQHEETPPLILPVVVYSGDEKWSAATDLAELLPPCGDWLWRFQTKQEYVLISMQHGG